MTSQRFWCLSLLTWIFFLPSMCSGMDAPKICLNSTVFVALANEDLSIEYKLKGPANHSEGNLTCYDPSNRQIFKAVGQPEIKKEFKLNKPIISGEYYCHYKTAKVYWFIRARGEGYKAAMWDTEFITLSIFTVVLLVFSVVGSVYVFRGHWKEWISECGNSGRKQKQDQEERTEGELNEDHVDVITASTSFYASLEPRPRSIYDVLNHSAAISEPEKSKAAPKTKETPKKKVQTTQQQEEGVFECVYENF